MEGQNKEEKILNIRIYLQLISILRLINDNFTFDIDFFNSL